MKIKGIFEAIKLKFNKFEDDNYTPAIDMIMMSEDEYGNAIWKSKEYLYDLLNSGLNTNISIHRKDIELTLLEGSIVDDSPIGILASIDNNDGIFTAKTYVHSSFNYPENTEFSFSKGWIVGCVSNSSSDISFELFFSYTGHVWYRIGDNSVWSSTWHMFGNINFYDLSLIPNILGNQIVIFSENENILLKNSLASIDNNGTINIPSGQQYKIGGTALSKSDIGLSNVSNNAQIKKATSSTIGYIPKWDVTTGDSIIDGYSVSTTLAEVGLDNVFVTEKAIRTAINNIKTSHVFNSTTDWIEEDTYYYHNYEHNKNSNNLLVNVWDNTGTSYDLTLVDIVQITNDIIQLRCDKVPDNRFSGILIII
jgi:hypothetical protein